MPTASGYITAVQEERFRVLTDDGRTFLLTLSHRAGLNGKDLCRLHEANRHVDVEYEGSPNLANAVAHTVRMSRDDSRPRT